MPNICKDTKKFLEGKEVACKFLDGWKKGKVYKLETSRASQGYFSVRIKGIVGFPLYDLKKDAYKTDWVLLQKCS